MTKHQHDYLLSHLRDLEDSIKYTQNELRSYADFTGISVSSIAAIASQLNGLLTEQRTICFTLRHLGYYVVYKDNHAEDIVPIEQEE